MRTSVVFLFVILSKAYGSWEPCMPRSLPGHFVDVAFHDNAYWLAKNGDGIYCSRDLESWSREELVGKEDTEYMGEQAIGRLKVVNGRLVATGGRELIMTRDSGGGWIVRHWTPSGMYSVNDIAFGAGKWVAVGGKTTAQGGESLILVSDDLISWSVMHGTFPLRLMAIEFVDNQFVVGGGHFETGGWIFRSHDLEEWDKERVSALTVTSVLRSEMGWTATTGTIESFSGTVLHSSDGELWAELPLKPESSLDHFRRLNRAISFNGGLNVIGSEVILRSDDALGWQEVMRLPEGLEIYGVTETPNGLLAVGSAGLILTSIDGITWRDRNGSIPLPDDGRPIAIANGVLFSNAFGLLYSDDACDWIMLNTGGTRNIGSPIVADDRLFALGRYGAVLESRDGRRWREVLPGGERFATLNRIVWWREKLWGAGPNGRVIRGTPEMGFSLESATATADHNLYGMLASDEHLLIWSQRDVFVIGSGVNEVEPILQLGPGATVHGMAFGGGRYVLIGSALVPGQSTQHAILTSDNGKDWIVHKDLPATFSTIAYGDGMFRASTAGDNALWVSFDGVHWTKEATFSVESLTVSYRASAWWLSDPINMIARRVAHPRGLKNFSALVWIGAGQTVIVGFVTDGPREQEVLVRAVGPDLTDFGASGVLGDPQLSLIAHRNRAVVNSDTDGDPLRDRIAHISAVSSAAGAFPLSEIRPGENADVFRVGNGAFSIHVRSRSGASGLVLIEGYACGPESSRIINASVRTWLSQGFAAPIFGLVSSSSGGYLLRSVSESLRQFGIEKAATGVNYSGYGAGGTPLFSSDQLHGSLPKAVQEYHSNRAGAFPLQSFTDEQAVLVMLPDGVASFPLIWVGAAGETLFEVYPLP